MNKESVTKQLSEIKHTIQMAFEETLFGRMIIRNGIIGLAFYDDEENFLRQQKANIVLAGNIKEDKWSITQYGIISYGTQSNPECEYGYYRIGVSYDDPITAAKEAVKLLNE